MLIVCMGTGEITILKKGHSLIEFRLGFLRKQLQSFLVLNYGSVKYLNPWIIKHNNLTFGTGQSYKEPKLRRLLQKHFKISLVLFPHVFHKSSSVGRVTFHY